MSIAGVGSRTTQSVQSLVDMRAQLDDLQRQLGTGKKSTTYAGVGVDRGLAVGLRAAVSLRLPAMTTPSPMSACGSISRRPRWAGSMTSATT